MKKYRIREANNASSYYKILYKDGTEYTGFPSACYSGYSYGTNKTPIASITVYIPVDSCCYSLDFVKQYISHLNEIGFVCKFSCENNEFYEIEISSDKNPFINKKLYTLSTMFVIRYLYHSGLDRIPENFQKIIDVIGEDTVDKFKALQIAHFLGNFGYANTNHSVRLVVPEPTITKEHFFSVVEKSSDFSNVSMTFTWHGNKTIRTGSPEYKEKLKNPVPVTIENIKKYYNEY